ncbi:MAG: GGDEF domain-containing phosphodiesterase [Saccharofermentans sp.]|nr:GGDEF domain-containing phosphodiesterase [Saccharofermentans sp.]
MNFYSDILELIKIFDYTDEAVDLHNNPSFVHLTDALCINRISYQILGNGRSELTRILFSNNTSELGDNYDFSVSTFNGKVIMIRIYRYQYAAPLGELEDLFTIFSKIILNKIAAVENGNMTNRILYYDQQMDVYNLNYLYSHINKLIINKTIGEYCVIFINIIQCRVINKLFGTDVTTKFLKNFCTVAQSILDESKDEILTRLGGDNFVVIFRKDNTDKVINTLKEVPVKVEENNDIIEYTLYSRMGVVKLSNECKDIGSVMNPASAAYSLSRLDENPNIYFYVDESLESNKQEEAYAAEIKKTLEDEKFLVYFQPIVSKNNNEIKLFSAEALIRWRRQGEMLNPRTFLKVADKYNLMCDIDLYVLKTVCQKLNQWIVEGISPVCIHCNFADSDLLTPNLPEKILSIIDEYNIHHSLINIEFAESAYHKNKSAFNYTISKLYNAGVKISIDNFGRNFTSLELFEELDFTTLKIDSSIVNSDNSKTRILLSHLITLSDNLGIEVVCEGADTLSEIDRAFEAGCDIYQSEIFEKALSERYFTNRLKNPLY